MFKLFREKYCVLEFSSEKIMILLYLWNMQFSLTLRIILSIIHKFLIRQLPVFLSDVLIYFEYVLIILLISYLIIIQFCSVVKYRSKNSRLTT